MAVTPADVRAIAKDYVGLADADIQLFLDEAVLRVNRDAFGKTGRARTDQFLAQNRAVPEIRAAAAVLRIDPRA